MTNEEKETILVTCFDKARSLFHRTITRLTTTRDLGMLIDDVKSYSDIFAVGKYRLNAVLMCRYICEQIRDYCVTEKINKAMLDTLACCFGQLAAVMREESFDQAN